MIADDRGGGATTANNAASSRRVIGQLYDQSSSVASESDEAGEDDDDDDEEKKEAVEAKMTMLGRTTKQMSKQVGGIASHKSPVLSLGDYILKPLKLSGEQHRRRRDDARDDDDDDGDGDDGGGGATTTTTEGGGRGAAGGGEDVTKRYRGVREIAFYEALQFASTLPSDLGSRHLAAMMGAPTKEATATTPRGWDDGRALGDGDDAYDHRAIRHLLSLRGIGPEDSDDSHRPPAGGAAAAAASSAASSVRSCRHPCPGGRRRRRGRGRGPPGAAALAGVGGSVLSDLGRHLDAAALLAAVCAGDPAVSRGLRAYDGAWRALIGEMEALGRMMPFVSPYFGIVDSGGLVGGFDDGGDDPPTPPSTTRRRSSRAKRRPHLLLRNLTVPYRKPNIIDIKMGTRTFEPTAPESKKITEAAKYPQQVEFGFRIVGMGVHLPSSDDGGKYEYWDKSFGVGLKTKDDVVRALSTFFQCEGGARGEPRISRVLSSVVEQLTRIKVWFETENSSLAFYASSILIAYEGNRNDGEVAHHTSEVEPVVKIIDFAHVCRQTGEDGGYLKGVLNLLEILDEIWGDHISVGSD
jgi:hypothetical protein